MSKIDHPVTATPVSLLLRLKTAKPDAIEWEYLQAMYLPLVQAWLARVPGLGDEAADLAQDVLVVLVRELPRFERIREGSFRAWLRRITVNRARAFCRQRKRRPVEADAFLMEWEDPASALSAEWDREHDRHVFERLLRAVEADFSPTTWAAFQRASRDRLPAAMVAVELGISENAVLQAKSRVLKRLRAEAAGLIE